MPLINYCSYLIKIIEACQKIGHVICTIPVTWSTWVVWSVSVDWCSKLWWYFFVPIKYMNKSTSCLRTKWHTICHHNRHRTSNYHRWQFVQVGKDIKLSKISIDQSTIPKIRSRNSFNHVNYWHQTDRWSIVIECSISNIESAQDWIVGHFLVKMMDSFIKMDF